MKKSTQLIFFSFGHQWTQWHQNILNWILQHPQRPLKKLKGTVTINRYFNFSFLNCFWRNTIDPVKPSKLKDRGQGSKLKNIHFMHFKVFLHLLSSSLNENQIYIQLFKYIQLFIYLFSSSLNKNQSWTSRPCADMWLALSKRWIKE